MLALSLNSLVLINKNFVLYNNKSFDLIKNRDTAVLACFIGVIHRITQTVTETRGSIPVNETMALEHGISKLTMKMVELEGTNCVCNLFNYL